VGDAVFEVQAIAEVEYLTCVRNSNAVPNLAFRNCGCSHDGE
jgi:hypothetical protein